MDTEVVTDNPTDDDITIDGLTMKVTLQDDNIQQYGHAHCFVNSPDDEVLEKILEKFPNRTVAYLNLGDAYWGLDDKAKAKEAYQTYIKQMKESGKEKKIPQVVLERVK